jgi:hypothetical protein
MRIHTLKDRAQLALSCGLITSGIFMAASMVANYQWLRWLGGAGVFLGVFLWPLSFATYLINLILTTYRNTIRDFWIDWCPMNFGLALWWFVIAITGTGDKREDYSHILLPAVIIGLAITIGLSKTRVLDSRPAVLVFNLALAPPVLAAFPFYKPYLLHHVLSIAVVFIMLPIMRTVTSDSFSRVH